MATKLAIIAGGGSLPWRLAEACQSRGRSIFVVCLEGFAEPALADRFPGMSARLGAGGAILDRLRTEGVQEVCLAGAVRRPSLSELRPDFWTACQVARAGFLRLGDDALLSAVGQLLEREGLKVVGAAEVLDTLLARPGILGRHEPDEIAQADIDRGWTVCRALGRVDVGQAVVVQQGIVLAVEAAEGTDEMLRRCLDLQRDGPGGVLVKARKPQQDARLDLPTIGPRTLEAAAASGLRGLAVEAGGVLVLAPDSLQDFADRHGLFVVGIEAET